MWDETMIAMEVGREVYVGCCMSNSYLNSLRSYI